MIKYHLVERKNPITKAVKLYAQKTSADPIGLDVIAQRIESRTTMSDADVKGVLSALQHEIIEALKDGHSVRLGDLGSFRIGINSGGVLTEKEWKAESIKGVRVHFTKSAKMGRSLRLKSKGGEVSVVREGTAEAEAETNGGE